MGFSAQYDAQQTVGLIVQRDPILQCKILAELIDDADAFARLKVLGVIADFERVQLFQYGDGDGNPVVLKTSNGIVVV